MDIVWRIELFGGLRAHQGDRVVAHFPTQKTGLLLAYLAYYHQHPHPREVLIDQLWPDADPEAARASLRVALSALRRLLEPGEIAEGALLVASRSAISLDPGAFTTDVTEFHTDVRAAARTESATERAALLARAVECYRGELLPGHYDAWVLTERQHLAEEHLAALHQLGTALEQSGELQQAVEVARQAVIADPLREEAHYDLMRLYAAAGQPSVVLRRYQELERLLREELGETPSAGTRALADELRQRAHQVAHRRAAENEGVAQVARHEARSAEHEAIQARSAEPEARSESLGFVPEQGSPPVSRAMVDPPLRGVCPPRGGVEPSRSLFHHNLPVQLTRFIGRVQEMARVRELLESARLLTLTGAGGCGKTQLALQIGAELREAAGEGAHSEGGSWLVDLAPLSDPALVPQAVATALGARAEPEQPLTQTLVEYLAHRRLLLLLDNCEHLLSACAQLADTLLRHCPQVSILATSREGLGILGEQTYRVPSLSTPDPNRLPPLQHLQEFEAVRLFADRALLAQPDFAVTGANAEPVVQVCHRLDGIPLAIELAAARLKVLPVEQIAARLDDRFRLLMGDGGAASWPRSGQRRGPGPGRTALPRQQTLRAVIDWSYDLLSQAERRLLCRLSVFAGGFTLDAAEVVGADPVDSRHSPVVSEGRPSSPLTTDYCLLPSDDILDLLSRLVEKSLVGYEAQRGEAHYRLLETVRQYGRDRLRESGEEVAARGQHAAFFLRWAEAIEPDLRGARLADRYDRVEAEHDNLRAALEWSEAAPDRTEMGLRLAGALFQFWDVRRYVTEGRSHLANLLSQPWAAEDTAATRRVGAPSDGFRAARAKALHAAGSLAHLQHDDEAARGLLDESLAIRRELGDGWGIAESLMGLGGLSVDPPRPDACLARYSEALSIYRELGDLHGIAGALFRLAIAAWSGRDWGAARTYFHEALAISRTLGDRLREEGVHSFLGMMAFEEGALGAARSHFEASLSIARQFGAREQMGVSSYYLGRIVCQQGDYRSARTLWEECLALDREKETRGGAVLGSLAHLAALEGDYEAARALWEQSLAEAREIGGRVNIIRALRGMADVLRRQRDHAGARSLYARGLEAALELENPRPTILCLEELAAVWMAQGEAERAARLFGAVDALRNACAFRVTRDDLADGDGWVADARVALDREQFAAAWAEGRAMTREQAVAEALGRARAPDNA